MDNPSVIERVAGRAVVLRGADIDTDRIMPARFLKAISFEGLQRHLFHDDREAATAKGLTHPLDEPGAAGARILICNTNFGCGSSREHAPQAVSRWGFKLVLAESFAEIFAGNALAIGLVCATASIADVRAAMAAVEDEAGVALTVDLRAQTARFDGQPAWPITLPPSARQAWLSGAWDQTGLLLADYGEVERVEARLPYFRTTSRNA
jgi:3-isopropylmalate/(R)-2-methylmalate dehydratase small subunit